MFESVAKVAWCRETEHGYELGVEFLDQDDAFRARMVEPDLPHRNLPRAGATDRTPRSEPETGRTRMDQQIRRGISRPCYVRIKTAFALMGDQASSTTRRDAGYAEHRYTALPSVLPLTFP